MNVKMTNDQCRIGSGGHASRFTFHVSRRGFTILEVIIACALFFMASFAILSLVSQGLTGARSLQQKQPDVGLLACVVAATNQMGGQLIEGVESGDFEDLYPGVYAGYTWTKEIREVGSNRLFRVTFTIHGPGSGKNRQADSTTSSILLWSPQSPPGEASKGGFGA